MKRLISVTVVALTACAGTGINTQEIAMDTQFMQTLATLTQLDLFDRAAVERELHAPLQAYEQITIPPSVAYRSTDAAMAPFIEAKYETRNNQGWAALTLWLDDVRCYSSGMIDDKYGFLSSKFELVNTAQEKRGIEVAHSYPGHKNKLFIGYRKTAAGSYCVKNIEISAER